MSIFSEVHKQQKPCKNSNTACMGRLHGTMRGYTAHLGDERTLRTKKRNYRTNLWNSKGESWISIYSDVWQGANGNESRADFCLHESEKASKNDTKNRIKRRNIHFILQNNRNFHTQPEKNGAGTDVLAPLCLQSEMTGLTILSFI